MKVKIDKVDIGSVAQHVWTAMKGKGGKTFYAKTSINGKLVPLHRFIMGAKDEYEIDHKDGNGLNNTRSNLRWATRRQNAANNKGVKAESGYKGVLKSLNEKRWMAKIKTLCRKTKHLGTFDTKEQAASAYDMAAIQEHGEFATLNFPADGVNEQATFWVDVHDAMKRGV